MLPTAKAMLRARLELALETRRGQPQSIRLLAQELGVSTRVGKYELITMASIEGYVLEPHLDLAGNPIRGFFVCTGKRDAIEKRVSRGQAVWPNVGECNFCHARFCLDGKSKFCSPECRLEYQQLDVEARRDLVLRQISTASGYPDPSARLESDDRALLKSLVKESEKRGERLTLQEYNEAIKLGVFVPVSIMPLEEITRG